jgi:hypothetical protein
MARSKFGVLFDDDPRYTDRFGLLLILTTVSVTVLSLVDVDTPVSDFRSELGWITVTVVVGLTLLVALRASGVRRRMRVIADAVVAGAVALSGIVIALDNFTSADMGAVVSTRPGWLWVLLATAAPVVVVRRLLKASKVTSQTLAGAISAFLLIALLANYTFLMVNSIGDATFFATPQSTTVFMYYSLVTLTTLGYGDFAAATDVGRFLSTTEAVVGQIFLVTFVASLVSMHTGRLTREREASAKQSSDNA